MVSRDLARALNEHYPDEDAIASYLDQLRTLTKNSSQPASVPS